MTRGHAREPVPRPAGLATPCATCPKIPDDAPLRTRAFAVELSERNWRAWRHYQRCKAVGRFPDDPLVERHAAIIVSVVDAYDRTRIERLLQLIVPRGEKK